MNKNFVSKVLLSLYTSIPKYMRDNERSVVKRARFNYVSRNADTLEVLNEMLELNTEKQRLVNLKVLIDKALDFMLPEDKQIIYLRFVKKLRFEEISKKLDVSLRQTFRLYNRAVETFSVQLEYVGYTAERVEEEFGSTVIYKTTAFRLSNNFGKLD
jgi:Sigma-70, region 4.